MEAYIYILCGGMPKLPYSYTKSADPSEWQEERVSGAALFLQKAPLGSSLPSNASGRPSNASRRFGPQSFSSGFRSDVRQ